MNLSSIPHHPVEPVMGNFVHRFQEGYRNGVEIAICMYWSAGLFSSEWLTQQIWMDVIVNIAVKTLKPFLIVQGLLHVFIEFKFLVV